MAQVLGLILIFLCYFSSINPSSWMTSPLLFFLSFLRVRDLDLKLISGRQCIVGLSLFLVLVGSLVALLLISVVFVLFDQRFVSFWAPKIDFSSSEGWLEAGFCFCIDSFFYHLVPRIQVLPSIVQLSSNKWAQAFSKVAYQGLLIERCSEVKFLENSL